MNTTVKSLQAFYVKNGGLLTDTYSDICGGAAVGNYTTIPDCVAACAKLTLGGGGGAEKFVVTLTADDSGEGIVWTADKTVAEIVAADAAGKIVECSAPVSSIANSSFLSTGSFEAQGNAIVGFSGIDTNDNNDVVAVLVSGMSLGGTDDWMVTTTPIPTSSNAPLIVTLNAQGVGDKTYGEAMTAAQAGRIVMFNAETIGVFLAQSITYSSSDILIETNVTGFESVSGGANDTIQHA